MILYRLRWPSPISKSAKRLDGLSDQWAVAVPPKIQPARATPRSDFTSIYIHALVTSLGYTSLGYTGLEYIGLGYTLYIIQVLDIKVLDKKVLDIQILDILLGYHTLDTSETLDFTVTYTIIHIKPWIQRHTSFSLTPCTKQIQPKGLHSNAELQAHVHENMM